MSVTFYVTAGALLSFGVLMLVTGELSRKKGKSRPGRIALAAVMGFGVVGLSVKAFALVMLNSEPRLAEAVDASRTLTKPHDYADMPDVGGQTYPKREKAWQALPAQASLKHKNPSSPEKIDLGRRLFFDTRLSSTGTVSCASCHDITLGGDDGQSVSTGIKGLKGGRNAPTVINAAFMKRLFWDGRARTLEEQAAGPLMNPVEMGLSSPEEVVNIVQSDPDYVQRFQNVFNAPVSLDGITKAIAAFERTLITNNAPYDRFVRGDDTALSAQQIRGMHLFDDIGCRKCHQDPVFSVAGAKNSTPYRRFPVYKDAQLVKHYNLQDDRGLNNNGVWRVPSLRNVELTAPYFHNGSVQKLEDAVRVMATAQLGRTLDMASQETLNIVRDNQNRPLRIENKTLSEQDVRDIAAFLRGLTDTPPSVATPNAHASNSLN